MRHSAMWWASLYSMRHNRVLVSPGVVNIIKGESGTEVFESRIDRVVLVGVEVVYRRMDRR